MTLTDLRALCEKATKGPWVIFEGGRGYAFIIPGDEKERDERKWQAISKVLGTNKESNATFIAAARNLLPLLLDVAEKAMITKESHEYLPILCGTPQPRRVCPCPLCSALRRLEEGK